jgi:hypothetical protein
MVNHAAFIITLLHCGCNAIDDAELHPCTRGALPGSGVGFHREGVEHTRSLGELPHVPREFQGKQGERRGAILHRAYD